MSRPLRVLIVSPVPSHPPVQGNSARVLSFGAELMRRGATADFLYYGMEGLSKQQAEVMISFWSRFFFVRSLPLARPSFADGWGLDDWCPDALCDTVEEIVDAHGYDAVIVNYVWLSKVLTRLSGPLKIIDTHDLFGDRRAAAEEQGLEPRWFFTTQAEENRGFARADAVIGIQAAESAKIRARSGGRVLTIGHPCEPAFLTRDCAAPPSFTFGYIGSGNPWNVRSVGAIDAALAESGGARWALAGTISRRPLALRSNPFLMGVVDRTETFYDAVECVLNPMLGGTGLKIKTIEALAFGKPVIGTQDAFEGMPAEHAFHRLPTIEAMIEAMRRYLESRALRRELLVASRTLFVRYMATVAQGYDELIALMRAHQAQRRGAESPARPRRREEPAPSFA